MLRFTHLQGTHTLTCSTDLLVGNDVPEIFEKLLARLVTIDPDITDTDPAVGHVFVHTDAGVCAGPTQAVLLCAHVHIDMHDIDTLLISFPPLFLNSFRRLFF